MIRMANILPWSSLRGAIGQRVRLLTERLVVQTHPGTFLLLHAGNCHDKWGQKSSNSCRHPFCIHDPNPKQQRKFLRVFFYGLKRTIRSSSSPLDPGEQHAFHAWTVKLQGFAWHSPRHLPPSDTLQQRFAQTIHLLPPYNKLTKMKVKSSKTSYEFPYKPHREMTRRLSLRETCRNASGKL